MKPGKVLDIRLVGVDGKKEAMHLYAVTLEVGRGTDMHVRGLYISAKDELDAFRQAMKQGKQENIDLTMLGDDDEN